MLLWSSLPSFFFCRCVGGFLIIFIIFIGRCLSPVPSSHCSGSANLLLVPTVRRANCSCYSVYSGTAGVVWLWGSCCVYFMLLSWLSHAHNRFQPLLIRDAAFSTLPASLQATIPAFVTECSAGTIGLAAARRFVARALQTTAGIEQCRCGHIVTSHTSQPPPPPAYMLGTPRGEQVVHLAYPSTLVSIELHWHVDPPPPPSHSPHTHTPNPTQQHIRPHYAHFPMWIPSAERVPTLLSGPRSPRPLAAGSARPRSAARCDTADAG